MFEYIRFCNTNRAEFFRSFVRFEFTKKDSHSSLTTGFKKDFFVVVVELWCEVGMKMDGEPNYFVVYYIHFVCRKNFVADLLNFLTGFGLASTGSLVVGRRIVLSMKLKIIKSGGRFCHLLLFSNEIMLTFVDNNCFYLAHVRCKRKSFTLLMSSSITQAVRHKWNSFTLLISNTTQNN